MDITKLSGPPLQLTTHKLDGNNYHEWSISVRVYLRGISREKYLTDAPPDPISDSKGAALWQQKIIR